MCTEPSITRCPISNTQLKRRNERVVWCSMIVIHNPFTWEPREKGSRFKGSLDNTVRACL